MSIFESVLPMSSLFNSFIEIKFTNHVIHPFKVCTSIALSISTELWNHHYSQFEKKMKVVQLCLTFSDPMDCSPPDSSVHGILQARMLECVDIPFSRGSSWPRNQTWVSYIAGRFFTIWATREAPVNLRMFHQPQKKLCLNIIPFILLHPTPPASTPQPSVSQFSRVRLFSTPSTAACQASLSITNSWSLPKLMSIKSVMPSNHLICCHPLLLLPSIFSSIRVFSSESVLRMRWPKYWSLSFSISLPRNIQCWFPLGWTGWISLQSKGLWRVFFNTIVQKHRFFGAQLSL